MTHHVLRLHRNPHGQVRAEAAADDPAGRHWAQFFETELAGNAAFCDRLLAEGEAHHTEGTWKTSGNAFGLTLDAHQASLRPLFGKTAEQTYVLPAAEFLDLVRKWRELTG
jgi:hypothetical protein